MVDGQNGVFMGIVVSHAKVAHKHEVDNAIHHHHLEEAQDVQGIPRKIEDVMGIHVLV